MQQLPACTPACACLPVACAHSTACTACLHFAATWDSDSFDPCRLVPRSRGKPTCHKVYGEEIAILAGDALLRCVPRVPSCLCSRGGGEGMQQGASLCAACTEAAGTRRRQPCTPLKLTIPTHCPPPPVCSLSFEYIARETRGVDAQRVLQVVVEVRPLVAGGQRWRSTGSARDLSPPHPAATRCSAEQQT